MARSRPAGSAGWWKPWLVGALVLAVAGAGVGLWRQRQDERRLEQTRHQRPLPRRIAALNADGDAARDLVMISQDRLVVYLGKDKP